MKNNLLSQLTAGYVSSGTMFYESISKMIGIWKNLQTHYSKPFASLRLCVTLITRVASRRIKHLT